MPVTERFQLVRADSSLDRAHEQIAQLLGEAAGGQRRTQAPGPVVGTELFDVATEQLADQQVLLGTGEQPRRRLTAQDRLATQQPERVGVERAGQRLAYRAGEPPGDPLPQLVRGAAAEGEYQDVLWIDTVALDPVDHRLDQRRGLARAGPGEDEQRATAMVDDRALRRVERWGGHRFARRSHETDVLPLHHTPKMSPERRHPTTTGGHRRRRAGTSRVDRGVGAVVAFALSRGAMRRAGHPRGCRRNSTGNPPRPTRAARRPRCPAEAVRRPSPPATTAPHRRTRP